MCYQISFDVHLDDITALFPDLMINDDMEIVFPSIAYVDGFNHAKHPVMVEGRKDTKKHLGLMTWGFLPDYVNTLEGALRFWNGYVDEKGKRITGYTTLNVISEEMFDKPLFKEAAKKQQMYHFL